MHTHKDPFIITSLAIAILYTVLTLTCAGVYHLVQSSNKIDTSGVNYDIVFDPCVLVYVYEKDVTFKEISEIPDLTDEVRTGRIKRPSKISDSEFDELVRIGWCEAGLEGFEGICLVYDTVLNRVRDKRFPSNVHDVLHAPGQYETVNTQKFKTCTPSKECYDALNYVLENGVTNKDVLYFGRSPITKNGVFKHNHHYFSN